LLGAGSHAHADARLGRRVCRARPRGLSRGGRGAAAHRLAGGRAALRRSRLLGHRLRRRAHVGGARGGLAAAAAVHTCRRPPRPDGASAREVGLDAAAMLAPAAVRYWGKRLLRGVPPRWMDAEMARRVRLRRRVRTPRHDAPWPSHVQWQTYLSITSPYYGLKLEAEERRAARAGLEMRYPLLDSRLVELVLAIPWRGRASHGTRKRLLRTAAADLLPPRTRDRRGKGDWTEPVDRALRRVCESGAPLANRSGRLARYVHPDGAARLGERYRRGEGDLGLDVWSLGPV